MLFDPEALPSGDAPWPAPRAIGVQIGYSGLADSYALPGDREYGILSPQDVPKAKTAATKAPIQALAFGLGGECYAVAMWIDLAFHYPAGSQGFGCLARNELNTVVAILSLLFSGIDVLHC